MCPCAMLVPRGAITPRTKNVKTADCALMDGAQISRANAFQVRIAAASKQLDQQGVWFQEGFIQLFFSSNKAKVSCLQTYLPLF